MKKILSLLSVLFLTFGCYDDSDIRNELRNHEERLAKLETLCKQMNTNISSLQTIVTALQDKDYVTSVAPINEGDKVVGYTITFSKSGAVTIHNGKDGYVPSLGVKQESEGGVWYWTVDGEWLFDSDGGKVRASAGDGEDGSPGQSGVTPQLKIVDGYWYVSYDGGKTWEEEPLGTAGASDDESIFTEVTYDADYVYLTLTDGEKLTLPRKTGDEITNPETVTISEITASTVVFTGHLDVPASDLPFSKVTVYYSDSEIFNVNMAASESVISFDSEQNFTIILTNLKFNTKYNYCVVVRVKSEDTYGEVKNFATDGLESAINLSSYATANCYIVSEGGIYKFKAVKGNSDLSVGNMALAEVLWESFGTAETPSIGDLIEEIYYNDVYIAFKIADAFKEGNAVIAAKDADGNILWSWHIWLTDQPQAHVYNNNAGTMMDRNLGATSATPGDVGALGLLYQWGRKDPFLGSSSISGSTLAKSTITWPLSVSSNSLNGTIEYAIAHPTTFITGDDWYYTGYSSTDNTRWTTSETAKSIYDPCPAGWRVPDGGENGIWSKAGLDDTTYDSTNEGMSFSISSPSTTWYPASGYRYGLNGALNNVGSDGDYWSVSLGRSAYYLCFDSNGFRDPAMNGRANGCSVRCLQVIDEVAGANAEE